MTKRTHLLVVVLVTIVLFALGVAAVSAASAPAPSDAQIGTGQPGVAQVVADTDQGVDNRLKQQDFAVDTLPSDDPTPVSRDQAFELAKKMCPRYAQEAASITVRHVKYTNGNMASLSDAELAKLGVRERPKGLDSWMITFHKVTLHRHGPIGSRHTAADANFVLVISATTGEFVEASGFGPVQ